MTMSHKINQTRRFIILTSALTLIIACGDENETPDASTSTDPNVPSVHIVSDKPPIMPSEQPPVMPSEQPPVIPSEERPVIPSEEPPVIPSEQPPVIPSEEPPVIPSEEPPVIPSEEPPVTPDTGCVANLLAGDLVITEVMANPEGADATNEWLEIYNTTTTEFNLEGLQVHVASQAQTSEEMYVFPSTMTIKPNQYLVVGNTDATPLPVYIDYSYGNALGMLRNSDALIELRCTETAIVDVVSYTTTVEGKSIQLDGAMSPDAIANDNPNNHCASITMYDATNHGTPQAANEVCQQHNQCSDNGTLRDIRHPEVGDLIITEVMANPDGVDGDKEWFEVFVTKDIDLNNLSIGENITDIDYTINQTSCLSVNKDTYLLFASTEETSSNGNLPAVDIIYGSSISLGNAGSGPETLALSHEGTLIDSITWTDAVSGISTALDPEHLTAIDNDDLSHWCDSFSLYGNDGQKGTPKMLNDSCSVGCQNTLTVGQLVITEVMANPDGADANNEWFEIYNTTTESINLLGLTLKAGNASPGSTTEYNHTFESTEIAAQSYHVSSNANDETAVPDYVNYKYGSSITLRNSTGFVSLYCDDTLLDTMTYQTVSNGASLQLNMTHVDTISNDTETNWCTSTTAIASTLTTGSLFGTPQQENSTCQ